MIAVRLRDLFVAAPAAGSPADVRARPVRVEADPPVAAGDLAIVCAAEDARAVGVAAGALLARRRRVACSLVCLWTPSGVPQPGSRPPSSGGARRLAASLRGRGLDATAYTRAVAVGLPGDAPEAVVTARRALAAAGSAPAVVVLGGARDAALDVLLADQRRVIVLSRGARAPDDHLTALALAGLAAVADAGVAEPIVLGAAARAAAASGVAIPLALRRAITGAMDRLDEHDRAALHEGYPATA